MKAISILKDREVKCILKLAGDGELRELLEIQTKNLGLADRVEFLGNIPHNELLDIYRDQKINLVVLPSLDLGKNNHEGIPFSLIEAMAYGMPVVSTKTGGIPELLKGKAGLLVPPQNSFSLAEAIEKLIRDQELCLKISQRARKRIEENFHVRKTVSQLIEILNELQQNTKNELLVYKKINQDNI